MNSSYQTYVASDPLFPPFLNYSNFSELQNANLCYEEPMQKPPYPYYGEQLSVYRSHYSQIHGYLSLTVCLFGISANILNIIVLTRKNMLSPTNSILTGLAVADMLVMFSYVPYTIHNHIRRHEKEQDKYTYRWAIFTLFHANFTVVCHTISIWLTVTVAIWRFMAVCYPALSVRWRGLMQARTAILSTYICCVIFCIPVYLSFHICQGSDGGNYTYTVQFSELAKRHGMLLQKVTFWMFSVVTKLVPCVALTALSFGLIRVLYEASQRRQRLKVDSDNAHDRTTRMLLAVLLLFLATEFPSGMLALLTGVLGTEFYIHVYSNFGETMDILALVNSAVNFIIYCSMSRQFRDTFAYLFFPKFKGKWVAIPATEPTQTLATACV